MQITCHNCRYALAVNPAGGQFRCPTCGAVNAVGTPVQPQYWQQHSPQPPYAAPRPAPQQKDNRWAMVLGGVVLISFVTPAFPWVGTVLGVLSLAWAIAGALGKVKGPLAVVFAESTRKSLLTVGSIFIGAWLATCGVVSFGVEASRAEREARAAEEKAKREAAEKAEREKREAEEAAARAAHEAELRANVAKAAKQYGEGLDVVQALADKGKLREAGKKLLEVEGAAEEYRRLDPVPDEIKAHMPRHGELNKKIASGLAVLDAADQLDANMKSAAEMTRGTKDGARWKEAQGLWQAALKNVDTLEKADDAYADFVPEGLSQKRKTIEKELKNAASIVAKYEKEQAELEAYVALCGDKPIGCGGGWDGECAGAELAFEQVANDPSDVDVANCSAPVLTGDDCWHSTCTVLARNGFGARVRQQYVFRFSKLGAEVVGQAR